VDGPVMCSVHGRVKRLVICNDLECGWSGHVFGPRSGQKVSDM
jgi:hypothetical protein